MAEPKDIEMLLKGREIIDKYRNSVIELRERPPVSDLIKAITELGFASIDEFFAFNKRLCMLEISRCYKGVNRFTDEEPPVCDGCLNRHTEVSVPDCRRDPRTLTVLSSKEACTADRLATGKTWAPQAISLAEDSIYQAQDAKYKELGIVYGIKFSIMDTIDWWDYPDHTPPSCCAKLVEVIKPDFDITWGLR